MPKRFDDQPYRLTYSQPQIPGAMLNGAVIMHKLGCVRLKCCCKKALVAKDVLRVVCIRLYAQ